jgi:cytochrome c oxidase assembly factor CtaG
VGGWTVDPLQLAPVLVVGGAYARRAWMLRRRGRAVRWWRAAAFGSGILALALAVVSPLDTLGESRLFALHMAQHLLLGDVAPLLLVLGLSGPLLRPLLTLPLVPRLRALAHPLVALPLWALDLYLWHVPVLYDAAVRHAPVHAAQHLCFFTAGLLLWTALLEPLPGPAWYGSGARLVSLAFVWVAGGVLSNLLMWAGHAFYAPYVHAPRLWGLSPYADQQFGGGIMLVEMSFVVFGTAIWLGVRWLGESERRQQLVDAGVAPDAAARAVRYGR